MGVKRFTTAQGLSLLSTGERRKSPSGRRWTDRVHPDARDLDADPLSAGPFSIDDRQKAVFMNGTVRQLTRKEYELFRVFLMRQGEVLSCAELAAAAWQADAQLDPAEVKQYVYLLRRKIEIDPCQPQWIRTVRGFGYQFVVSTQRRPAGPRRRLRIAASAKNAST